MDYQGLKDLKLIEKYLKNYNEMIVNLFIHQVDNKSFSVLDFGAGIGTLAEIFYKKTSIKPECFEICKKSQKILTQKGFKLQNEFLNEEKYDLIFSSNVLEHIEPELIDNVISELAKIVTHIGFISIHMGPAGKILEDGRNAHLIQKPTSWWLAKFINHFDIIQLSMHQIMGNGFWMIIKPKKEI